MKPMLAAACTDLSIIEYPVLASPKLDGIRAIVLNGVVLSRSFKPIPNQWVQDLFGREEYNGFDGELIVGPLTAKDVFNRTSSGVMKKTGTPDVTFWVFDNMLDKPSKPFANRLAGVQTRLRVLNEMGRGSYRVTNVHHQNLDNVAEAEQLEQWLLEDGYEGMMVRSFNGPYKYGRSSLKEGYLLKVKRFKDGEAEIIGMTELLHNSNEVKTNELGEKERSSKKANLAGKDTMGSLLVRDLVTKVQFEIGTGFTAEQRTWWWDRRINAERGWRPVVAYKYQTVGVKDKPRFPVYKGLRDRRDMS